MTSLTLRRLAMASLLSLSTSFVSEALAITTGQTDDFEDLTTQGWTIGVAIENPSVLPTGGPAGDGDAFLRYESFGGGGPGNRLVVFNTDQWTGDFAAARVTGVLLDAQAFEAPDRVRLRVAIGSGRSAQGGDWFVSTDPVVIEPGEGWRSVFLPLDEASMTRALGTASFADLFGRVGAMRILSSSAPSVLGDSVPAVLGLDNITAVPEGSALGASAVGLVACLVRRQRAPRPISI